MTSPLLGSKKATTIAFQIGKTGWKLTGNDFGKVWFFKILNKANSWLFGF